MIFNESILLARDLQVLERESALRGDRAGAVVEVDLDEEGWPGLAPQREGPVGRVPVPAMHHRIIARVSGSKLTSFELREAEKISSPKTVSVPIIQQTPVEWL